MVSWYPDMPVAKTTSPSVTARAVGASDVSGAVFQDQDGGIGELGRGGLPGGCRKGHDVAPVSGAAGTSRCRSEMRF